jgi:hypothetical protein
MKYYKVKETSDQCQVINKSTKNGCYKIQGYLFANELITEKELKRKFNLCEQFTPNFIKNNFDIVNISKNDTYFFFGARKQCTLNK